MALIRDAKSAEQASEAGCIRIGNRSDHLRGVPGRAARESYTGRRENKLVWFLDWGVPTAEVPGSPPNCAGGARHEISSTRCKRLFRIVPETSSLMNSPILLSLRPASNASCRIA